MKRLLLLASAFVLVLAACGAGDKAVPPARKVALRVRHPASPSWPDTKAAAGSMAEQLLDVFVPPRRARILRHGATRYHWPFHDPGAGLVGKRVDRHRVWFLQRSVASFEKSFEMNGRRGWDWSSLVYTPDPGRYGSMLNTDATYTGLGFGGRRAGRLLNLAAVREPHGRGTILRADVLVAWHLSAAERERVPTGVREIDISGSRARWQATDPKQVRAIVAMFDRLEIEDKPPSCETPSLVVGEPVVADPTFHFAFLDSRGKTLASASLPEFETNCSVSGYSIRGRSVQPLYSGGIVYRVQELLGTAWPAAQREARADERATALLRKFRPPPGATKTTQPKEYGGALRNVPTPFGEFARETGFWRVAATPATVVAFLQAHDVPSGFHAHCGSNRHFGSTQCELDTDPAGSRSVEFSVQRVRGGSILRVDAQVGWVYPRSPKESVRASRVREIDFSAPNVSKQVTDPSAIARIVRSFNNIPIVPPGIGAAMCGPLQTVPVTLDFLGAGGKRLAHLSAAATEPQGGTSVCNPMTVTIAGAPKPSLISADFIGRVQRAIGVTVS